MIGEIYKPEDKFLCSLMNFCSDCFEPIEDGEQNLANSAKTCKDEQNPAWSEEDEQYVKDTLALLSFGCSLHSIGDVQDWLKSLKGRVQPKQEWSEEDEKKRTLLIRILEVNHPNGYFKVNPANTLNMEAMHTEELVTWLKDRIRLLSNSSIR